MSYPTLKVIIQEMVQRFRPAPPEKDPEIAQFVVDEVAKAGGRAIPDYWDGELAGFGVEFGEERWLVNMCGPDIGDGPVIDEADMGDESIAEIFAR